MAGGIATVMGKHRHAAEIAETSQSRGRKNLDLNRAEFLRDSGPR